MLKSVSFLCFFIAFTNLFAQPDTDSSSPLDISPYSINEREIMDVISQETQAWWNRDYEMWSNSWHHAPYISWNGTTNVMHLEYLGWDALSKFTQESFKKYPDPNLSKVERSDWQFRIYKKGAWVRFTQKGEGTSREVRILEKHKGKWKIVHVGWIDESSFEKG